MRVERLQEQGLEATRYMERYVNNVKGAHEEWSDTDIKYSPHEGVEDFPASVFELPSELTTVLTASPDPRLTREVIGKDVVKFFSHPEMGEDPTYLQEMGIPENTRLEEEIYTVTPTSSTRTMLTKDRDFNFMVKTDLDKKHFRFIRRLKGSSVAHSIQISQELSRIADLDDDHEYSFLPESMGIVVGDKDKGAGVVFREVVPRPLVPDRRVLVPYFSLYAGDLKNPDDEPLLIQLIGKNASAGEELDFYTEEVLGKIVRNWTSFATKYGLLLELHGQNTLLEIDEQFRPQRIVHRDFQSIYIDADIRRQNGLLVPFDKHLVGEEAGTNRETQYSIAYDHQVGDFLLERLTKTFLEKYPQYTKEQITTRVQSIFRQGIPNPREFFPEETYTYGKQGENNDVNLVVKHEKGIYR